MPPFWGNVKQVTFLQYAIHEFKSCSLRVLFFINVVKIYLLRHIRATKSHAAQFCLQQNSINLIGGAELQDHNAMNGFGL